MSASAAPLSSPRIDHTSQLPTVLTLHIAQSFLHDRDVVAFHAASSTISRQLLPSSSQPQQYRRKTATRFYFIYDDQYQAQYITDQNPKSVGFVLERAWIAKRGADDGDGRRKVEGEGETERVVEKQATPTAFVTSSNSWILRTPSSSRRLGLITKLSIHDSWLPTTLSSLATPYLNINSIWDQIKDTPAEVDEEAAAAIAAGEQQPTLLGELDSISEYQIDDAMHIKAWGLHWFGGGWIPSTIEELYLAGPILSDSQVPSLAHCRKLHTIEYGETYVHHLTVDPAIYPPSLRCVKYGSGYPFYGSGYPFSFVTPEPAMIRFPQTITDLIIGSHLFCEGVYEDNPNVVPIPSSVEKLAWGSISNNAILKWTEFPPRLRELTFKRDVGDPLDGWQAPQTVELLDFGSSFVQDLKTVVLPASLTEMRLSQHYESSLAEVKLPKTFKKLVWLTPSWAEFEEELPDFSETSLEEFVTPRMWNREDAIHNLPETVHTVILGQEFNQPIKELMQRLSTMSITHLQFGAAFDQPWDASILLPSTLKHLIFARSYGHSLADVVLPTCLETIQVGPKDHKLPDMSHTKLIEFTLPGKWNRVPADELKLPPTLKKLVFGQAFSKSIKEFALPPELTSLRFGDDYNNWSSNQRMPDTLTELAFGTKFIAPLTTNLSNTKLKSLVLPQKWNASLKDLKLPLTFESLEFGRDFNQPMSVFNMPQSLTRLVFGEKFKDATFAQVALPTSLRHLEFHSLAGVYAHALPRLDHLRHLETLILSAAWNQELSKLELYHDPRGDELTTAQAASSLDGLRHLTFGASFNQSLERFRFPVTLQTLKFGASFDQPLNMLRLFLPKSLKRLELGDKWNHSLTAVQLPTGLEHLRFGGEFKQSVESLRLPHLISFSLKSDHKSPSFLDIDSLRLMPLSRSLREIALPHLMCAHLTALAPIESLKAYEQWLKRLSLHADITIHRQL